MDVSQALEQLDEIRHHITRSEVYRGYRSRTVAVTGASGLIAAAALSYLWPNANEQSRIGCWVAVAAFNLALVAWEVLGDYGNHKTDHQRRVTQKTVGQFLPAICFGALLTAAAMDIEGCRPLLPGIWTGLYAMGVFSSRPYMPRGIGWVGAFYLASSAVLLAGSSWALSQPWAMGGVFGTGQLLLAYVLYKNLERTNVL